MAKRIFKYALSIADQVVLWIPKNHKLLSTGQDPYSMLCVWAEIDENETVSEYRRFRIIGTGNPMPPDMDQFQFVGSVLQDVFMWHIYAEIVN